MSAIKKEWKDLPADSAKRVVLHAAWAKSRGRGPSMAYNGIKNPIKALTAAKNDVAICNKSQKVMPWLAEYADLANDVALDGQYDAVIGKLENAGYKEDDGSFDAESIVVTSTVMAKYVAGNAIYSMKKDLPPIRS